MREHKLNTQGHVKEQPPYGINASRHLALKRKCWLHGPIDCMLPDRRNQVSPMASIYQWPVAQVYHRIRSQQGFKSNYTAGRSIQHKQKGYVIGTMVR